MNQQKETLGSIRDRKREQRKDITLDTRAFFYASLISICLIILLMMVSRNIWEKVDSMSPLFVMLFSSGIVCIALLKLIVGKRKMW